MKTLRSIDESIRKRKATVYTAAEIKEMVRSGAIPKVDDVDVITCGTFGIMSGTMAILSVPVASQGDFRKADSITMNGVPGIPGPCPNESLGIVDCVIYGTSKRGDDYGGGHLFADLVRGNEVDVEVLSNGTSFKRRLTLKDMPFARMMLTRGAFKNYTAFVNTSDSVVKTIFSVSGMRPCIDGSVSGCGDINPLENDPHMRYLKEGAPVMINGARGMITGTGTRSTPSRPNLSAYADMKEMDADMMSGFITSAGPECMVSVTAAIPITDERSLNDVCVLNENVALPIADVNTRIPSDSTTYSQVWEGTSKEITVDEDKCLNCPDCNAGNKCPAGALNFTEIDKKRCVVCGACVSECRGNVFSADLGVITYNGNEIPITLRQSDRNRAEAACVLMKDMVKNGNWDLGVF